MHNFASRTVHRVLLPNESNPATSGCCALAIMSKAPRAGRVKTRLSPPLTPEEAAELNRCFLRDISASIARAGDGTRGICCYTPVGEEDSFREIFSPDFQLLPQRMENLSDRLIAATEDLFGLGFAAMCLINSDSPTVPAAVFAEAGRMLALPGDRVVLGPCDDGGYYLIGLKQPHHRLFMEIDWSTERVLAQTRARAEEEKIEVHLLPLAYDVDDPASLRRLCQDLLGPNEIAGAPATRAFLRTLVARPRRERIWAG